MLLYRSVSANFLYFMIKQLLVSILVKKRAHSQNKSLQRKTNKKLSRSEKQEVAAHWGTLNSGAINCFQFYKSFGVFNPKLVPNDIYANAERLLNPFRYSLFAQHKCCLKYFLPAEYRPKTILQNIDNHYLDKNDKVITLSQAVSIAEQYDCFMIKIAAGSGGGRGIRKVYKGEDIASIFADYHKDFICQEVLKEHQTLAQFNPECINTIRLLSLNINDRCDVLSAFVRMGGKGSIVDNLHSEKGGGCLVGINPEGKLAPFGINKVYKVVKETPMGDSFDGLQIEHYDEIVDFIKNCHQKYFPFANLIGWDVIIDESAHPIVIEINLDSADIAAHQIFNGPVFGERTDEVLEYMTLNAQKLVVRI